MKTLEISDLKKSPYEQFALWFSEIEKTNSLKYPNAMSLSTIDEAENPDTRIVLLKHYSESGFVFFTNSTSTKGKALAKTPKASLTFYWDALERQVRIQGEVITASSSESDEYFQSRPRESQIGAWASLQSQELDSRATLEKRFEEFSKKYEGTPIPRPPHWHGYRVTPKKIEFWQAQAFRLHDRFVYTLTNDNSWNIRRLYP